MSDVLLSAARAPATATAVDLRRFTVVAPGVIIGLLGFANGGYFAPSWGLAGLAAGWLAIVLLFDASWFPAGFAFVAMVAALTLFSLLSALWGGVAAFAEAERGLLYVSVLMSFVLGLQRVRLSKALGATIAAVALIDVYALLSRLVPGQLAGFDPVAGYRLAEPLGYWNALGILSALALVLALFSSLGGDRGSLVAAATVPIAALTIYFTFSRGAIGALVVGFLVGWAASSDRFRKCLVGLAVAVPAVALVAFTSRFDSLTHTTTSLASARREGAIVLAALALAVVASVSAAASLPRVVRPLRSRQLRLIALALGASVVLIGVGEARAVVGRVQTSFAAPPTRTSNLNARFLMLSSNRRVDLWHAAWQEFEHHRALGGGAGSFERNWLRSRPVPLKVRDAHSLYLETLAELGPLGLLFLLIALGIPVYAGVRARAQPLVPALLAAYTAYLVHAAVDWDWEMPAVTITALFCGAAILVAARKPDHEERRLSPRLRQSLIGGMLVLTALTFVALVGNMTLSESAKAARRGDWRASAAQAREAAQWAPWSPRPWQQLGEAQLAQGKLRAARASFRTAIAKDSGDWELWFDLARATSGRTQMRALARAARLDPLGPEIAELRRELS